VTKDGPFETLEYRPFNGKVYVAFQPVIFTQPKSKHEADDRDLGDCLGDSLGEESAKPYSINPQ